MSDARGEAPIADEAWRATVISRRGGFDGHIWSVRTDHVRLGSGEVVERDAVHHPGAVGIVAIDDRMRVLFVRQYRHPAGAMLWEPPAGLLDVEAEAPVDAAARELYEEAGYRARTWHVLVDAFTSPGMSDESVRIFLARDLTEVAAHERHEGSGEERDMPCRWLELPDAVRAVMEGRLHNPMGVMGVLAAAHAAAHGFGGLRDAGAPWMRGADRVAT